jgi:hypothetical protein
MKVAIIIGTLSNTSLIEPNNEKLFAVKPLPVLSHMKDPIKL